jgi:hypothetical protein
MWALACGLFQPDPQPDGESCDSDEGCRSGHCVGGICAYSSCGSCAEGFSCEQPGAWVEVLSLGLARGTCVPTCEVCPWQDEPRWMCHSPSSECTYDASVHVTLEGPATAEVGEPVRFVATIEPDEGREVETIAFALDSTPVGDTEEVEFTIDVPGVHWVDITVTDDVASIGSAHAEIMVCGPTDTVCTNDADCCVAGDVCRWQPDGMAARCGPAPRCGDGVRDDVEQCDGTDVPPTECSTLGQYHPGPLESCTADCLLDVNACQWCATTFDACTTDADCCEGLVCDADQCLPS